MPRRVACLTTTPDGSAQVSASRGHGVEDVLGGKIAAGSHEDIAGVRSADFLNLVRDFPACAGVDYLRHSTGMTQMAVVGADNHVCSGVRNAAQHYTNYGSANGEDLRLHGPSTNRNELRCYGSSQNRCAAAHTSRAPQADENLLS